MPAYVEDELRGYLECGLLCFGFARAVCMTCRTGFVVALSCKGRGVCPSCNGRHIPRATRPRLGGISFLHHFGSALSHHVHLHACVTDGVFVPAADDAGCDAAPAFLPARPITPADLAALGVWLVFSQENVPDPFRAKGKRDRHRLLRSRSQSLARYVADCMGEADGSGGGGVSTCVPHLRRRHPGSAMDRAILGNEALTTNQSEQQSILVALKRSRLPNGRSVDQTIVARFAAQAVGLPLGST